MLDCRSLKLNNKDGTTHCTTAYIGTAETSIEQLVRLDTSNAISHRVSRYKQASH